MSEYFYVVNYTGEACGHRHAEIGPTLARCAATARRAAPAAWRLDLWVVTQGEHKRAPREAREALAALLSTRGRGRPAGQTPRVEQASPLYARLSVAERQRYEAVALAAGIPDLGKFAVTLLEQAAQAQK